MQLGIALDGMTPITEMVALAREADARGLDTVWIAEHMGYRDGPTASMAVLAATGSVTVAPAAISVYSRHPMISAMTAATLEEFAPRRTIFTLATGNPRAYGPEMGLEMPHPLDVTREYIEVLRQLWCGRPVTYAGRFFRLTDATFYVVPSRTIPIFVAAIGPRMLELAGELGDGAVFSAALSPSAIQRSIRLVETAAQRAGRDPKMVAKVAILVVSVAKNRHLARQHARAFIAYGLRNRFIAESAAEAGLHIDVKAAADAAAHGDWVRASALVPDELIDQFAVAGTLDECRARLATFLIDGLDSLVFLPLGESEARRSAIELATSLT